MNGGDTKVDPLQLENAQVSTEPKGGLPKKGLLAFAAIPLGRAFGVKIYLSVYNILWLVWLGYKYDVHKSCWGLHLSLAAYGLTFPIVFIIAGLVKATVGKKFGAEPSAVVSIPGFVVVWFQNFKLPQKALTVTLMSWPLAILGFLIFWIILIALSLNTHDDGADYHPGDCIPWNTIVALISIMHALTAWYTLVLALLPIWPGPCFLAFCLLISKFGVSKRATVLRMGAVSIAICLTLVVVSAGFSGYSPWVRYLVGEVDYFIFLLVLNVLVMGCRFLFDANGESWAPFSHLADEFTDSGAELGYVPLVNPSSTQSL